MDTNKESPALTSVLKEQRELNIECFKMAIQISALFPATTIHDLANNIKHYIITNEWPTPEQPESNTE